MKISDLQERFGDRELHSLDSAEENKLEFISLEMATAAFPAVKLSSSEHVSYFPFKLCHSIPRVNSRGRTFMPKVLQKSFASLMDQCLDYEHELVDNNTATRDRIIGHVKAVKFDVDEKEIASGTSTIPTKPLPVLGLGCVYKRADGVQKIIDEVTKKPQSWRVSMECYHDWQDAYFWHDKKELININDAPAEMLDCIGKDCIKPYKGKDLAVCIGGLDKEIAFLGAALTTNPADSDADILGFVSGINRELSSQKTFFMPLREFHGLAKEVASGSFSVRDNLVEHTIKELANIGVIGETGMSGAYAHKHQVLSDGTIMPANGHMHRSQSIHITGGSKATFSGVTDPAYEYAMNGNSGVRSEVVHNHTWNIDLRKKVKVNGKTPNEGMRMSMGQENYSGIDISKEDLDEAIVTIGEHEMKLNEVMAALAKEMASASAAEKPDEMKAAQGRIAELANKLEKLNAEEEFKARVDAEVKTRIEAGQLIPKEKADEAIAAAKTVAEQQLEAEKKRLEIIQDRRNKCLQAGVNPEFEFDGVTNASGKPMTVNDRLSAFGCDEVGEKEFVYNFAMWKKIADQGLAMEKEVQKEKEAASKAKEAASAGGNGSGEKRPQTMHLAGGGPPPNAGAADATKGFGTKPSDFNRDQLSKHKHNAGIHLLVK